MMLLRHEGLDDRRSEAAGQRQRDIERQRQLELHDLDRWPRLPAELVSGEVQQREGDQHRER